MAAIPAQTVVPQSWFNNSTTTAGSIYFAEMGNYIRIADVTEIFTPNGSQITMKKKAHMPAEFFFKLMKKKMGFLKDHSYATYMKKIEKMVNKAAKEGQIAYSEELMKKFFVLMREAEMYAAGYRIFLPRDIFEAFRYKTKRTVQITALKNYARPIPDDVMEKGEETKKLKLFDDYWVMHYDAPGVVKETQKETKERREKDPILFGSVEYSDKLYFIADWEDEFCDLTLDDIIDVTKAKDADMTIPKNPVL